MLGGSGCGRPGPGFVAPLIPSPPSPRTYRHRRWLVCRVGADFTFRLKFSLRRRAIPSCNEHLYLLVPETSIVRRGATPDCYVLREYAQLSVPPRLLRVTPPSAVRPSPFRETPASRRYPSA